jgi:hypothetical protein
MPEMVLPFYSGVFISWNGFCSGPSSGLMELSGFAHSLV